MPTAAIAPGCPGAPDAPVAGLPRRDRLARTLARRGFTVVPGPGADRVVPDCRVLVGEDEIHLCEAGVAAAEERLLESLRKPIDGLVSRTLNRRVSLAITRRLMHTGVVPNHVSAVTLLIGVASGFVVALGGYGAGVAGAALLQLQSILDGVDGELARLRFQHSHLGQWLDTLSDDLANLSFLVGCTVVATWPPLFALGVAGCLAFVVTEAIQYYVLATVYRSGDLLAFKWEAQQAGAGPLAWLKLIVKRDFFCLGFLALALLGRLDVALALGSLGALAVLATLLRQIARRGLRWTGP